MANMSRAKCFTDGAHIFPWAQVKDIYLANNDESSPQQPVLIQEQITLIRKWVESLITPNLHCKQFQPFFRACSVHNIMTSISLSKSK